MGPEQVAGFLREYSVTNNWLGLMAWVGWTGLLPGQAIKPSWASSDSED